MSHAAVTRVSHDARSALAGPTGPARADLEDPEAYTRFRALFTAADALLALPALELIRMHSRLLQEMVQREVAGMTSRPDWMRGQLELVGDAQLVQMLRANVDHLGGAAQVRERFGIPRSSLHRMKDDGMVIAYRPTEKAEFLFPFEQFPAGGNIGAWPGNLVLAVGNGAPALHFLYVPRKSLAGESFAEALRAPQGRDVVALLEQSIDRLANE